MITEADVLSDLLRDLQAQAKIPDDTLLRLESNLRRQWGGERVYIAKTPLMRDELIRGQILQGIAPDTVAMRLGVSRRKVFYVKAKLRTAFK